MGIHIKNIEIECYFFEITISYDQKISNMEYLLNIYIKFISDYLKLLKTKHKRRKNY